MKRNDVVRPVLAPRALTPKQKRILKSLLRRKFYDTNHPKRGWKGYPILRRAFVPANYQGHPSVVLLCQITSTDRRGNFEYCIFSDGLYGRGHYASDKYGCGQMRNALASFEDNIVHELFGSWKWVIEESLAEVKRFVAR